MTRCNQKIHLKSHELIDRKCTGFYHDNTSPQLPSRPCERSEIFLVSFTVELCKRNITNKKL